jgi:hypothetical protein
MQRPTEFELLLAKPIPVRNVRAASVAARAVRRRIGSLGQEASKPSPTAVMSGITSVLRIALNKAFYAWSSASGSPEPGCASSRTPTCWSAPGPRRPKTRRSARRIWTIGTGRTE